MALTRLKGLDGIRAICALIILWGHIASSTFCHWDIKSIPLPDCCAYVFFVISGFLAGYRIDSVDSFSSYYKKKAKRILPLYYSYVLLVVLCYLLIWEKGIVLNSRIWYYLLLVPQIPFCQFNGTVPLTHLWFIGSIVLFYLLFPLFAKIKDDKRTGTALCISIVFFLFKLVSRLILGKGFIYRLVSVNSFDIMFMGVWAGLVFKSVNPIFATISKSSIISIFSWLLFLTSGLYISFIPAPIRNEFITVLAVLMIITQQGTECKLIDNPVLNRIGMISYELYVVHILIIVLLSMCYNALGLTFSSFCIYLMCTIIVLAASWLFYSLLHMKRLHQTN